MNFAKFLRTPFLQNTSGRLLLYFTAKNFTNGVFILYHLFPPLQINHYSDSDESTSSDTSGNNERVTTDNVFHLISDEGN